MNISQTSPGNLLRELREKKGLTIEEVAKQLHLTTRQVKALEENDHSPWPSLTYVHGYLRNYAHLLGIDDKEVLRAEPTMTAAPEEEATLETHNLWLPFEHRRKKQFFLAILIMAFLGMIIFIAIPWIANLLPIQGNTKANVQNPAEQSIPAISPTVPSAVQPPLHDNARPNQVTEPPLTFFPEENTFLEPTVVPKNQLMIRAHKDCWVGVYDQNGQMIFNKVLHGGEEASLTIAKPFVIRLGRANAVALFYEGSPVDLSPYQTRQTAKIEIKD